MIVVKPTSRSPSKMVLGSHAFQKLVAVEATREPDRPPTDLMRMAA